MRELDLLYAIGLQDLNEELTVVLLLEIQVPLLVAWIRQVLGQLLYLLREVLEAAQVLLLGPCLLGRPSSSFDGFAVRAILNLSIHSLSVGCGLLSLFRILIFLKIFLGHLALDDHETCVDKGFFEKLTLEHSNQVFNPYVLSRWSLDDPAVGLDLLLLCEGLLGICLCLLGQGGLVLLEKLLGFF